MQLSQNAENEKKKIYKISFSPSLRITEFSSVFKSNKMLNEYNKIQVFHLKLMQYHF